ncbi:MAG: sulfotransferase [Rivularia sp. (in: cyanobacteria)]
MLKKKIASLQGKMTSEIEVNLARIFQKRQTQLYCIGTAKSGTHSIASMFNKTVRSQHEPQDNGLIEQILDFEAGRSSSQNLKKYIRTREKQLHLDVDSSQLNFFVLDILINEFNNAKFLLTIRDCYSWLNSIINDSLRRTTSKEWIKFRDFRFKPEVFEHQPEENILKEHGLYTLNGYLSYWAMHNKKALSTVPDERLLIVRTDQISNKAYEIAEFAGLTQNSIDLQKSHAFKNPTKYGILSKIDSDYLEQRVHHYCQPLMKQFFPEIKTMKDANL